MMVGAGPMSIREAAHRLERDVSAVHADVQALLNCGVLDKAGDRIVFPYDAMRIEATMVPAG
jgi:predicted transcriptional regulator